MFHPRLRKPWLLCPGCNPLAVLLSLGFANRPAVPDHATFACHSAPEIACARISLDLCALLCCVIYSNMMAGRLTHQVLHGLDKRGGVCRGAGVGSG